MLNEYERELITAAVDGGLAPSNERAFRNLRANSPDAVVLFNQLQTNSLRLREAPRYPAPARLAGRVMVQVRALPSYTPVEVGTSLPLVGRKPTWVPIGIAVAVLLAVGSASFWITIADARETEAYAHRQRLPLPADANSAWTVPTPAVQQNVIPVILEPEATPSSTPSTTPNLIAKAAPTPEPAPSPRAFGADGLVASPPVTDLKPFEEVQLRLPFLVQVADLGHEDVRSKLHDELNRDPAYRIDLFARDVPKALENFQTAAKAAGINLAIEAVAKERIAKKVPSAWVIYTEVLTANELTQFLVQLAKLGEKSQPFATAHVVPAQANEHRELRDLLGVDPGLLKRPKTGPKPISAGTADEISAALLKGKSPEKPALLMTYLPSGARSGSATSKEIKAFLDHREERKPNAVPAMIVIRPSG